MEREVLTFRDKVGTVLMSSGLSIIIVGIFISLSWLGMPRGTLFPIKLLVVLVLVGIGLIRTSFYTVERQPHSS